MKYLLTQEDVRPKHFPLGEVMTTSEAEQKRQLPTGSIRVAIQRGKFQDQIKHGLVRQSGKVWLITEQAMREVFGE